MQIDRSNYEIWLIDWIDGNLTDLQIEKVQIFLTENPDLQEEFNEMYIFKINSSFKSFPFKARLKKYPADLSASQFEYWCIASLEHDLTSDQKTELNEITELDPERKRTFELFKNVKLSPPAFIYNRKNHLIKRTVNQKVLWFSVIGLSVAATLAFIIINYFLIPHPLRNKNINTSHNIISDTSYRNHLSEETSYKTKPEKKIALGAKQKAKPPSATLKNNINVPESDMNILSHDDSLTRVTGNREIMLNKIPVQSKIFLKREVFYNDLIAFNPTETITESYDRRSTLGKFIAKTFRERILKEKATNDKPLKGFEIAEAGVSGLNKLFGWQMELNKKNNEKGEPKSVYFSSKILKFNAPVKKSEPLP